MSLSTPVNGGTILASDVSQLVQVLQRTSGSTEQGAYVLNGWANAANDTISQYICSLSRVSVPVSVSIDTSINSPTGVNSPFTNTLRADGFHVACTATVAATNSFAGGLYTITY